MQANSGGGGVRQVKTGVDDALDERLQDYPGCQLCPSAVGTSPYPEFEALVVGLSRELDTPAPTLLLAFGLHLFGPLAALFPQLVGAAPDALPFLAQVEHHIHVEVRKLYPDAQMPRFTVRHHGAHRLEFDYDSPRPLGEFDQGMMQGCLNHFGTQATITRTELPTVGGQRVRFLVEVTAPVPT